MDLAAKQTELEQEQARLVEVRRRALAAADEALAALLRLEGALALLREMQTEAEG